MRIVHAFSLSGRFERDRRNLIRHVVENLLVAHRSTLPEAAGMPVVTLRVPRMHRGLQQGRAETLRRIRGRGARAGRQGCQLDPAGLRRYASSLMIGIYRVVRLPADDYLAALQAAVQRARVVPVLAIVVAAAASWWVYVPIHELCHAFGCCGPVAR